MDAWIGYVYTHGKTRNIGYYKLTGVARDKLKLNLEKWVRLGIRTGLKHPIVLSNVCPHATFYTHGVRNLFFLSVVQCPKETYHQHLKEKLHHSITNKIGVKTNCPPCAILNANQFHIKNLKLFWAEKGGRSYLCKRVSSNNIIIGRNNNVGTEFLRQKRMSRMRIKTKQSFSANYSELRNPFNLKIFQLKK